VAAPLSSLNDLQFARCIARSQVLARPIKAQKGIVSSVCAAVWHGKLHTRSRLRKALGLARDGAGKRLGTTIDFARSLSYLQSDCQPERTWSSPGSGAIAMLHESATPTASIATLTTRSGSLKEEVIARLLPAVCSQDADDRQQPCALHAKPENPAYRASCYIWRLLRAGLDAEQCKCQPHTPRGLPITQLAHSNPGVVQVLWSFSQPYNCTAWLLVHALYRRKQRQ
jgi:hypothetical protein